MSDVAAGADVSRVTLYRHFADRDTLRHAAFMHVLDRVEELVQNAIAHPKIESDSFSVQLSHLIDSFLTHGMLTHLLLNGQDYFEPALVRVWTAWMRPIVRFMQAAQDRGELRNDLPPKWQVTTLLALVQTVIVYPGDLSGRNTTQVVLKTFLDGAATPDSRTNLQQRHRH